MKDDELVRRHLEEIGGRPAEVEHAPVDPEIAVEVAHGGHRRVVERRDGAAGLDPIEEAGRKVRGHALQCARSGGSDVASVLPRA